MGVIFVPQKRIAVITARADETEQKEIIKGITETAFAYGYDVFVFSNIYNHWVVDKQLNFENVIYSFFEPCDFDGAIITAEAFMDIKIIDGVMKKIKKSKLPAVIIDGKAKGFESVFSDDEKDMEALTEHLILKHNLRDFHILTGFEETDVSHKRVEGCKKAFEKHNIPFDESKVFYGNFWNDSGEKLAKKYINGEIHYPQCVICTNDNMAYGLCDTLTNAGINIPKDLIVTGYDYTNGRIYHYPLLTSFLRNRKKAGCDAVNFLLKTNYQTDDKNRFVSGNTCPCGIDEKALSEELLEERIGQYHTVMSSVAQFSGKLTLCRTLSEYTEVLKEFFYLLHHTEQLFLCLDTQWNSVEFNGDEFICCEISENYLSEIPQKTNKKSLISQFKHSDNKPYVYYLSPVCFQTRLFGCTALSYSYPTGYDFSYRDFNKTISNALEFLRMKNDIHYLKQCQSVSSLYDSLTGFYNLREFRQIASGVKESCFIKSIKLSFTTGGEFVYGENFKSDIVSHIAKAIKSTCKNHEICCRADEDLFLILCTKNSVDFNTKLKFIIDYAFSSKYDERQAVISFSEFFGVVENHTVEDLIENANTNAMNIADAISQRNTLPHYNSLVDIRKSIKNSPQKAPSLIDVSRRLCVSEGYFRTIYKKCFGVSYNQDVIDSKIQKACYLLYTTAMSIYAVSVSCGFDDEKYFSRQFHKITKLSPSKFRSKYC